MIGQKSLIGKLNTYSKDNFPQSILLVGEEGSGKHTFINEYIKEKLGFPIVDISDRISFETITNIYLSVDKILYIVDCSRITIKDQNAILKVLEEPYNNAYIILICTNKSLVLDTIINRCQVWYMDKYSHEELLEFTSDEIILETAITPGQVLNFKNNNIADIKTACKILFDKGHVASLANLFLLSNKISWDNKDPNLFSYDVFKYYLSICAKEKYIEDNRYKNAYILTMELLNRMSVFNIDKKRLFEGYLAKLNSLLQKDICCDAN